MRGVRFADCVSLGEVESHDGKRRILLQCQQCKREFEVRLETARNADRRERSLCFVCRPREEAT